MRNLISKMAAEATGTFALVFAGCGGVMVAERFPDTIPALAIPITFGLVIAAMIYAVGHISGAHFNPVVTAGFAVARHFPLKEIIPYWVAQFLGGLVAMTLLSLLLPQGEQFGATVPMIASVQAVFWEAILSFFLMFVIISVATDTRAEGSMAGTAIGITVMLCALFGGPVTGASMNPARSLAPAIFEGTLSVFWIYVVGPTLGAISAAIFYEKIRCSEPKSAKGCC